MIPDNLLDVTFFRICNGTYDSGLRQYNETFSLNSLGLLEGNYELSYYSVDFANNIEVYNYQTVVLDNSPPELKWLYEGCNLQDDTFFEIVASGNVDVSNN